MKFIENMSVLEGSDFQNLDVEKAVELIAEFTREDLLKVEQKWSCSEGFKNSEVSATIPCRPLEPLGIKKDEKIIF